MANVAFLFSGVGELSGGGGAERFFSGFFEEYNKKGGKHKLFFISDKASLENFNKIGKFAEKDRILTYKLVHNRFKHKLEFAQLIGLILRNNIKLIQVPLYGIQYYNILSAIDKMPAFCRPRIVITIVDSFVPHHYLLPKDPYNFKGVFGSLFESVKIDAVICWNELFKTFAEKNNIIKSKPKLFSIVSRYTDKVFDKAAPKKDQVVYAGRFTMAKRPLMFVEAVNLLIRNNPEALKWKFLMYGKGHQEPEVLDKIKEYKLEEVIKVSHAGDLTKVFEESKCFVSTQDHENFPSLAMNEAMAAGNAIITRNVGQTSLFVKDMKNGILCDPDNEIGLAKALQEYISHPEWHKRMSEESIRLTEEVHNFSNFKVQIEDFWDQTLALN